MADGYDVLKCFYEVNCAIDRMDSYGLSMLHLVSIGSLISTIRLQTFVTPRQSKRLVRAIFNSLAY